MKKKEADIREEGFTRGYEAAKSVEPTINDTKLATWFERDRAHIALQDLDETTIVEWWDDDVRDMFESGFFVSGKGERQLHTSVFSYALEHGLLHRSIFLAKLAFHKELETREGGWDWWLQTYEDVPSFNDPLWQFYEQGVGLGITRGLRERCLKGRCRK